MSDPTPVFLIGAARSGTKFLRDLIAASPDVAEVPYDINYVWRHGNEGLPHDELDPAILDSSTKAHIRREIRRLALRSNPQASVILEKTVSNALRVDFVRAVFPEAKMIYLERDGLDVAESSYRQWTAPPDRGYLLAKLRYFPLREWRYALWFARNTLSGKKSVPIWGPRYDGITDDVEALPTAVVCAHQWRRCVDGWTNRTPAPDLELTVSYRDLFENPERTADRIKTFVGAADSDPIIQALAARSAPVFGTFPGAIPSSDVALVRSIVSSEAHSKDKQ